MKRWFSFFQSKYFSALCFLFAVTNRAIFSCFYSTIGKDTKVQLTYAENLMNGKGYGVTKYFTADINTAVFDTQPLFPPGFSFTIIPFLKLFNSDEYKSILAFDIITAIVFIISIRLLGKTAGLSSQINNLFTIIAGCAQYPFFISGSPTDTIALAFVLLGFSVFIKIIERPNRVNIFLLLFYSLLFFLPYFFRYMYLPVTILFPLLILTAGFVTKNSRLKINGVLLSSFVFCFCLILFFNFSENAGNKLLVPDATKSFSFSPLLHWYPYIPASFINLDFAAQLAEKTTGISYTTVFSFFEILNAALFIFLLVTLFRFLYLFYKKPQYTPGSILILGGTAISVSIFLMLGYLSVLYKMHYPDHPTWNYNYDIRYFSFHYIFLSLLFLLLIKHFKNIFLRLLLFTGCFLFFTETLHGIYYNIKILIRKPELSAVVHRDSDYRNFPSLLKELNKKNPGAELLVSSTDMFYLHSASILGHKSVFDYSNLNNTELRVRKKTILLLAVYEADVWRLKKYFEEKKPMIVTKVEGTIFYLQEIYP